MFYFKKAFTLAEVLITLGIIGIVAAMTIPNLIMANEKRVAVTRLQKAISVLNQAYKSSFDDNGEPASAYALGSEQYFHEYWEPYIKIHTYCTDYMICGYSSNKPFTQANKLVANWSLVLPTARATFYTMDGFLYQISMPTYRLTGQPLTLPSAIRHAVSHNSHCSLVRLVSLREGKITAETNAQPSHQTKTKLPVFTGNKLFFIQIIFFIRHANSFGKLLFHSVNCIFQLSSCIINNIRLLS